MWSGMWCGEEEEFISTRSMLLSAQNEAGKWMESHGKGCYDPCKSLHNVDEAVQEGCE